MNSIKTERITARVSEPIKDTLGLAAGIMGATLNQFLVLAALEKAVIIIIFFLEEIIYLILYVHEDCPLVI